MKQVASAAGVSVETVYAQGSKPALLLACVDRALAGDDEPLAMTDRPPFAAALAAGSQREVVEGFVAALADVAVGAAGLVVAFEDAAAADEATADLWREAEQHRRADCRRLVEAVAARGPLRAGLDVETATDGLWVTATPRLAHQLAVLGWTPTQVADWTARAVTALLLPPDDRTPR
jgi:AcrR family transcriptional regulator